MFPYRKGPDDSDEREKVVVGELESIVPSYPKFSQPRFQGPNDPDNKHPRSSYCKATQAGAARSRLTRAHRLLHASRDSPELKDKVSLVAHRRGGFLRRRLLAKEGHYFSPETDGVGHATGERVVYFKNGRNLSVHQARYTTR